MFTIEEIIALIVNKGGSADLARQFLLSAAGIAMLRTFGRHASVAMGFGAGVGSLLLLWNLYEAYEVYAAGTQLIHVDAVEGVDPPADDESKGEGMDDRPICSICFTDPGVIHCEGETPHVFCQECFESHAMAAFQAGGSFCARITSNNGVESPRGQLPCPFFHTGECDCACIPTSTMEQHLSPTASAQQQRAIRRIAEQAQEDEVGPATALPGQTPLELLLKAVQDIMFIGTSVSCPHCRFRGEKDGACMHIVCGNTECRKNWCYCCGRSREAESLIRCQTCDRRHIYIEQFEGWQNLPMERNESAGYAALHEFHRRRVIYFLSLSVNEVPYAPWDELWRARPDLLVGVPTPNRQIDVREFQTVTEPPVFLPTSSEDIAWLHDADPIIERLRTASPATWQLERLQANDWVPHEDIDVRRGDEGNLQQDYHFPQRVVTDRRRGRRRRRWWRFWRRNRNRINHHEGPMNEQEEDHHIEYLVEQIIGNETLEDDIREVMLDSLLNPIHGMPDRAQRNRNPYGNQGAVLDNDQAARPVNHQVIPDDESRNEALVIQAEGILANEDIDEALRQALLESTFQAAHDQVESRDEVEAGNDNPADGAAGHHPNQDGTSEWYALRAEEIFANEGMEEDIRQALVESMYDPPEGHASHDAANTDVGDDGAGANVAAQINPTDYADEGFQQALMDNIRVTGPLETTPMQDEMTAIFEENVEEIVNDEALHPDVRQALLNSVFEAMMY